MRKILLVSHGKLAEGMKDTVEMIAGKYDRLMCLCGYVKKNVSIKKEVNEIIDKLLPEEELIIFVDILGGSISNDISPLVNKENIHIITGMNLTMILEAILTDNSVPAKELVEKILEVGKDGVKYLNSEINKEKFYDEF